MTPHCSCPLFQSVYRDADKMKKIHRRKSLQSVGAGVGGQAPAALFPGFIMAAGGALQDQGPAQVLVGRLVNTGVRGGRDEPWSSDTDRGLGEHPGPFSLGRSPGP